MLEKTCWIKDTFITLKINTICFFFFFSPLYLILQKFILEFPVSSLLVQTQLQEIQQLSYLIIIHDFQHSFFFQNTLFKNFHQLTFREFPRPHYSKKQIQLRLQSFSVLKIVSHNIYQLKLYHSTDVKQFRIIYALP